MFRLQDHTPSVYTEQSRDFQLLLRLYDLINNGVKFDIDSIPNINNPAKINDRLIELLCTKVGFFPKTIYDTKLLRYITEAFSYIIKYKGSEKGIREAVATVLKVEGQYGARYYVSVDNDKHEVSILTSVKLYNKAALEEILEYIMPIGYYWSISEYDIKIYKSGSIVPQHSLLALKIPSQTLSQIIGTDREMASEDSSKNKDYDFQNDLQQRIVGSYLNSEIVANPINSIDGNTSLDRNNTTRDIIDKLKNNPDISEYKTKDNK